MSAIEAKDAVMTVRTWGNARALCSEDWNIDRASWHYEHVTTPRESCLERLRIRECLRALTPGKNRRYEGIPVARMTRNIKAHLPPRYSVNNKVSLTYDEAIAELERLLFHPQIRPYEKGS